MKRAKKRKTTKPKQGRKFKKQGRVSLFIHTEMSFSLLFEIIRYSLLWEKLDLVKRPRFRNI